MPRDPYNPWANTPDGGGSGGFQPTTSSAAPMPNYTAGYTPSTPATVQGVLGLPGGIIPGPYASGYLNPTQADIMNQFGVNQTQFDLYNTLRNVYSNMNEPTMAGYQADSNYLRQLQSIYAQQAGVQSGSLRDAYGIDMARLGLQGQLNARERQSIQNALGIANEQYANTAQSLSGKRITAQDLHNLFAQNAQSKLGYIDTQRGSARTMKGLQDELAASQEGAAQRGIMNATIANGAGITGETRLSLDDLANQARIGRDTRNQSLSDTLAGLDQAATDVNYGIDKEAVDLRQSLADIDTAMRSNSISLKQARQQASDALFTNTIKQYGLGLDAKQLKNQLDSGLANIGFGNQIKSLDIMRGIASNDARERALSEQIMYQALNSAMSLTGNSYGFPTATIPTPTKPKPNSYKTSHAGAGTTGGGKNMVR